MKKIMICAAILAAMCASAEKVVNSRLVYVWTNGYTIHKSGDCAGAHKEDYSHQTDSTKLVLGAESNFSHFPYHHCAECYK